MLSTGAMIPSLILAINRYCSSHLSGALCGFSKANWGSFFAEDLGVPIEGFFSNLTGVLISGLTSKCSSFALLRGEGVTGVWEYDMMSTLAADDSPFFAFGVDLADLRGVGVGMEVSISEMTLRGEAGSGLTISRGGVPVVISVTREFRLDFVRFNWSDISCTYSRARDSMPVARIQCYQVV